jgi:riboflavin kinase/FMN adenylyltransferase
MDSRSNATRPSRALPGSTLVIIGNFDGVHRGHQWLCQRGVELARAARLQPLVLTFHPHPAELFGAGTHLALTSLERKLELLTQLSSDLAVLIQPFTRELAKAEPRDFALILRRQVRARQVLVGENFRFGRARSGNCEALAELGAALGFGVRAESLYADQVGAISSTRIRELISSGDLPGAERLLGRPHALSGQAQQAAHVLGQFSISVGVAGTGEMAPPCGSYSALIELLEGTGHRELGRGVTKIVPAPHGNGSVAETRLPGFAEGLHGKLVRLQLLARLPSEGRLDSHPRPYLQLVREPQIVREALRERAQDTELAP